MIKYAQNFTNILREESSMKVCVFSFVVKASAYSVDPLCNLLFAFNFLFLSIVALFGTALHQYSAFFSKTMKEATFSCKNLFFFLDTYIYTIQPTDYRKKSWETTKKCFRKIKTIQTYFIHCRHTWALDKKHKQHSHTQEKKKNYL